VKRSNSSKDDNEEGFDDDHEGFDGCAIRIRLPQRLLIHFLNPFDTQPADQKAEKAALKKYSTMWSRLVTTLNPCEMA
jgi:hypothetical protein